MPPNLESLSGRRSDRFSHSERIDRSAAGLGDRAGVSARSSHRPRGGADGELGWNCCCRWRCWLRCARRSPGCNWWNGQAWIPSLNVHYLVGIDGFAALFPPLTALLFCAVILASWTSIQSMPRLYFALLLALEGVTVGVFCALDLVLFFLFWELTLVPIYFLVSLWGIGPERRFAAVKYTLFMLVGGIPLLFAILLLGLYHATGSGAPGLGALIFDYPTLLERPCPPLCKRSSSCCCSSVLRSKHRCFRFIPGCRPCCGKGRPG